MGMFMTIYRAETDYLPHLRQPDGFEWFAQEASDSLDLDKAWHGIHFMFIDEAEPADVPLGFLLSGGMTLLTGKDSNVSARWFNPEETAAIARAMTAESIDELMNRFSVEKFTEFGVYSSVSKETEKEDQEYYRHHCLELKTYIEKIAATRSAMVVYLY